MAIYCKIAYDTVFALQHCDSRIIVANMPIRRLLQSITAAISWKYLITVADMPPHRPLQKYHCFHKQKEPYPAAAWPGHFRYLRQDAFLQ